jgi:hypothetical protein
VLLGWGRFDAVDRVPWAQPLAVHSFRCNLYSTQLVGKTDEKRCYLSTQKILMLSRATLA